MHPKHRLAEAFLLLAASSFPLSAAETPIDHPAVDNLEFLWWQYREAGDFPGIISIEGVSEQVATVSLPLEAGGTQIHLILEVRDLNPIASLYDYRRIVFDTEDGEPKKDPVL
ncbi:MAG: hypothetical protein AAGJ81_02075 [Verrucomicrobiota bacterium]